VIAHPFYLQPFPDSNSIPTIAISGQIARTDRETLAVEYQLIGDISQIKIPELSPQPSRTTELWEHTCFELFVGLKNSQEYWEFNLSPSGDWNVYHLDRYRQGLRAETAFTSLPFVTQTQADRLSIQLEFDLDRIGAIERPLDIGITTVIEQQTGEINYYALTHCGLEADFHLRDSFTITL
jgi:hypothetical protein